MLAFAANSLLCRLALGEESIDPASFMSIRVASDAIFLLLALQLRRGTRGIGRPDWRSATMLFAYMVFFSFAYVSLAAGTGALLLFGAVQLTMFFAALRAGERFSPLAWFGLALAAAGIVYLVAPGLSAPDPLGAALMIVAGIAWGAYSLLGRSATDPVQATASNFVYCLPLVAAVSLLFLRQSSVTLPGVALAIASGAIASGLGYVIWYAALRGLTAGRAATVQLSVPVIAALGGVAFLAETLSARLVVASVVTLGGVAIVLTTRARAAKTKAPA